jgi:hypothetical protein
MQNRSIKIPDSNRQILNLAFGVRYNISFFQIFLFFRFKINFHSCAVAFWFLPRACRHTASSS